MGRGARHDADYFPFYCKEGKTTKFIEQKYGNDGFAVWVKILRDLTTTNYHFLDLSEEDTLMVFAATCKVSDETLLKIVADLVRLGEFDKTLWQNDKIIWGDKFIESIADAYKNRKTKIVRRDEFIKLSEQILGKKLISAGITSVRNPENPVSYPQSRVEKRIEENSIEEEIPPVDDFNYEFVPRGTNDLTDDRTDVEKEIFNDEIFLTDLARSYPGLDYRTLWGKCWQYHSQKPTPPTQTWQWKQKLQTWLDIETQKKSKNGKQSFNKNDRTSFNQDELAIIMAHAKGK
jgi:hypothetical protein